MLRYLWRDMRHELIVTALVLGPLLVGAVIAASHGWTANSVECKQQ